MDINGRRGRIVLVYPEPNNRVQVKKGVTSLCRPTQEQRVQVKKVVSIRLVFLFIVPYNVTNINIMLHDQAK
jgi:hypothetical protein